MTAATGIKRVGLAVASLLGAGLALLLILSVVIPADTVRDAVKAQIKAVTGLDPVLRGDVSVSLFPTGSVRFNDVSLGDNRTGAPALSAEQLVVRLRFLSFLFGRIEIADVTLVRPTIMIAFAADGSSNWAGHIETLARALTPSPDRIKIVLGNPHQRRHRDHPRRGLPHRRDADQCGIRAGLAVDLAHLRGDRPVHLERAAVRRRR